MKSDPLAKSLKRLERVKRSDSNFPTDFSSLYQDLTRSRQILCWTFVGRFIGRVIGSGTSGLNVSQLPTGQLAFVLFRDC
jgi:hypothetical protein